MERLGEAVHASRLRIQPGSPPAQRVTGPSVEVLFDLLRVELLFMLVAPVNLADLASAGSSDDQHLHGVCRFPVVVRFRDATAGWSRNPQQPPNQQAATTGHAPPCERSCGSWRKVSEWDENEIPGR